MGYFIRGNARPQNLRIYFVSMVMNIETVALTRRAFLNKGYDAPVGWPGHELSMNSDEGVALLGRLNPFHIPCET